MTVILKFSLLTFVVTLCSVIPTYEFLSQPTRSVSIQPDYLKGGSSVYFVCPDVRSEDDVLKYYKVSDRTKMLTDKKNAAGVILRIKSEADLGEYECSVESRDKSTRVAKLNVMDAKKMESPSQYQYNSAETKYTFQKSGSVELNCAATADQKVTWYRPPQYHIHTGNTMKIEKLDDFSYGTYYCAVGETNKPTISVKKVILLPEEPKMKEMPIDQEVSYVHNEIPTSSEIQYTPSIATKMTDTITWEQPPGTIILDYGRNLYIPKSLMEKPQVQYNYRMQRNGDHTVNEVGKVFLASKTNDTLSFSGGMKLGENVSLICDSSDEYSSTTKVFWKKNGKTIHEGNVYTISKLEKTDYGVYSCEYTDTTEIKIKNLNLLPKFSPARNIEMTPDPGMYYSFHDGDKKEFHCELEDSDPLPKMKSQSIIWTFNGKVVDVKKPGMKMFRRIDRVKVSILSVPRLSVDTQGAYRCFKRNLVLTANLIMERRDIELKIDPDEFTVADNFNSVVEFHCQIDTIGFNASVIKWSFIPSNSEVEEALPAEAKPDIPGDGSQSSFLTINNALKKHEGIYVCRVKDKSVRAKVTVNAKSVLTVHPKEVTVKPGGTARFQCELTGSGGEVIWRRRDKAAFVLDKETRLPGTTKSLLEVKQATKADDGTVYECVFEKLTEFVTLWVKDDCPLNKRKCKDETCIDESKFCDGKNDCGDNSDEDPKRCSECSPNSINCESVNGSISTRRCVVKHWQCDGTDDCGNNFDELNCPVKNKGKCIGTHFLCGNSTLIPRAYWCDGEADCKTMEDEEGCTSPEVIEPAKHSKITVIENTTMALVCQISGRPIPTITWRFNWGSLPGNGNNNITDVVTNCSVITSTLTINNISPEQSGIYTCEAVAKQRVIAPDISVSVSKGSICKRPFFNNDAFDKSVCIKCYCSNVTDDCTSVSGYITNPDLIESQVKASDAAIINYKTNEYFENARPISFANESSKMYVINKENYKTLVPEEDQFLGGSFNMRGSWLNRYGYPLTYKLYISGNSTGHYPGPIVVMKGNGNKKVYYCLPKNRLSAYASSKEIYENNMRIILWEREKWYSDNNCNILATRTEFMDVLKDVVSILFRIKFFNQQTDFKMSKITMQEAIPSKLEHSWVPLVEKCNCPAGYSGLSCELQKKYF